jgi:hypothetical protein
MCVDGLRKRVVHINIQYSVHMINIVWVLCHRSIEFLIKEPIFYLCWWSSYYSKLKNISWNIIISCFCIISTEKMKNKNTTLLEHFHSIDLIWFWCFNATFNNISAISWSTRREPPTMGKQLVNFITCCCESSAPFL